MVQKFKYLGSNYYRLKYLNFGATYLSFGGIYLSTKKAAVVIPLNPEGMGIGEWVILFSENFEGMGMGMGNSKRLCA